MQANDLLPGQRARACRRACAPLRGHPAVVNVWGAWCDPCRAELPVLQRASLDWGKRVAFLGVDLRDNRGAARKLLGQIPLTYPSYEDPDGKIANSYRLVGTPATIYYNAAGKQTYLHQGPYLDRAAPGRRHQALRHVVTDVRPARDQSEIDAALALRYDVFCVEQGVSLAEERDGLDGDALHLVVVADGEVVGTCRLLAEGSEVKLGRMAVASGHRGRGLAADLLVEAEAQAREMGARRIALAAQLGARTLYERAGYAPYGDVFLDAGIEHVMMGKALE